MLPTADCEVPGLNPSDGRIQLMTVLCFSAQSLLSLPSIILIRCSVSCLVDVHTYHQITISTIVCTSALYVIPSNKSYYCSKNVYLSHCMSFCSIFYLLSPLLSSQGSRASFITQGFFLLMLLAKVPCHLGFINHCPMGILH